MKLLLFKYLIGNDVVIEVFQEVFRRGGFIEVRRILHADHFILDTGGDAEAQKEIRRRQQIREKLIAFIQTLKTTDESILELSEGSWYVLVDHVTVMENADVQFTMKNGMKM